MYVVMPSDKLAAFGKEQSQLTIKHELIVPKNTYGLVVESAAWEAIKDITFRTVDLTTKLRPASP
jgi:hypothetical protein